MNKFCFICACYDQVLKSTSGPQSQRQEGEERWNKNPLTINVRLVETKLREIQNTDDETLGVVKLESHSSLREQSGQDSWSGPNQRIGSRCATLQPGGRSHAPSYLRHRRETRVEGEGESSAPDRDTSGAFRRHGTVTGTFSPFASEVRMWSWERCPIQRSSSNWEKQANNSR